MSKQPAKKIAAKKAAAKKAAPKKTAPAKKSAAKKADPVKRAYNKVEKVAKENGIDFDAYEDKAIEVIEEASEKVVAEFVKNRKGFISKLFSWIKK
jgi:hypothetical protein